MVSDGRGGHRGGSGPAPGSDGVVTSYRSAEDRDGVGFVVVLADPRNAQAARELGFAVSDAAGAEGSYTVLCPGERWPCWDLARQRWRRPGPAGP